MMPAAPRKEAAGKRLGRHVSDGRRRARPQRLCGADFCAVRASSPCRGQLLSRLQILYVVL